MKHYIVLLLSCLTILSVPSCKKEGVNQNLDPVNQKSPDFMSTKVGSYWRYGTRAGVSYTRFARNRDTMKEGLKYSYYERRDDTTGTILPEYFGKNGEYHITLVDLDGTATTYLPYAFWKDSAHKGDTWTNTGSVYHPLAGNVALLTESYQAEEGITMTIAGKTYKDVIHVHSDSKATLFNLNIGSADVWFVKGIGMLREEVRIDIAGAYQQNHTDSLLDYHLEL